MARRQLSYTELRVAVFILATVALVIIGIFYVTGQGAWQPKYQLKTFLPEAEGLVPGAPVSLSGVQIGSVSDVRINPSASKPDQNIEVDMDVFKHYQNWIRANSTASLVTQGLLGSRYVTITRGMPPAPVLPAGAAVPGETAATPQAVVARSAELMNNLNGLAIDLRGIANGIQGGKGSLGRFLNDPALYDRLNDTVARADDLLKKVQRGDGTVGKLFASDDLYNHANSTVDRLDAVLSDVQEKKGTLGKLIYDPTLYNHANALLGKGDTLLTNVQAGKGTLGKLVTDPSLYNNLRDASASVRDLTAKINSGEGSAGKLVTDPQLYNNLTGLTGDLRLFMSDLRQHPKKYLRIRMTVF